MNKLNILILIFFLPAAIFAQSKVNNDTIRYRGEPESNLDLSVFLIMKTDTIEIDTETASAITPKWIRKIKVVKDENPTFINGKIQGIILIKPKRRYKEKVLEEIKRKTVPNTR